MKHCACCSWPSTSKVYEFTDLTNSAKKILGKNRISTEHVQNLCVVVFPRQYNLVIIYTALTLWRGDLKNIEGCVWLCIYTPLFPFKKYLFAQHKHTHTHTPTQAYIHPHRSWFMSWVVIIVAKHLKLYLSLPCVVHDQSTSAFSIAFPGSLARRWRRRSQYKSQFNLLWHNTNPPTLLSSANAKSSQLFFFWYYFGLLHGLWMGSLPNNSCKRWHRPFLILCWDSAWLVNWLRDVGQRSGRNQTDLGRIQIMLRFPAWSPAVWSPEALWPAMPQVASQMAPELPSFPSLFLPFVHEYQLNRVWKLSSGKIPSKKPREGGLERRDKHPIYHSWLCYKRSAMLTKNQPANHVMVNKTVN